MAKIEEAVRNLGLHDQLGKCFVGGKWVAGEGPAFVADEPWTQSVVFEANEPSSSQIHLAAQVAQQAQAQWAALSMEDREELLSRFVSLVAENKAELSTIVSTEAGKPVWEAEQEVSVIGGKLAATKAAYQARAASIVADTGSTSVSVETVFVPIGTCAVLGPYNFPLHMMNGQIIPALLAGNSVLIKPSEFGSASATAYTHLMERAGIPKGVVGLLIGGSRVGRALVENDLVDGVFFTGGAVAGAEIRKACAKTNKACAIEAGGNGVLVVDEVSDVNAAAEIAIQSTFWSAGQRCNNARHIFITKSGRDSGFLDAYLNKASDIFPATEPSDPKGFYGVLRRPSDKSRLLEHAAELEENGAKALFGSIEAQNNVGRQEMLPIVYELEASRAIDQTEYMGPIIQVRFVEDIDQAIDLANSVELRLSAGLLAGNRAQFENFAAKMKFGNLTWNCPTANASGYASFGGRGGSGNFRPAGYLAVDFCVTGVSRFMVSDE
ncbi:MAG: aldehyde dehydrogenase family protein [Cognatishimia sp.]